MKLLPKVELLKKTTHGRFLREAFLFIYFIFIGLVRGITRVGHADTSSDAHHPC